MAPALAEMAPEGQLVQALEPCWLPYLPVGHEVQLLPPLEAAYLPRGQSVHALASLLPLYLPLGHALQPVFPVPAAYFPLGHEAHVASALWLALPYLPAAQGVPLHEPCKALAWYWPGAQSVHAPAPAAANLPATHEVPHVAPALEVAPSGPA